MQTYREWGTLQNAHNRVAVALTWMNKLLVLAVVEKRLVIPEVSLPAMQVGENCAMESYYFFFLSEPVLFVSH